jgi:hypothetical protein
VFQPPDAALSVYGKCGFDSSLKKDAGGFRNQGLADGQMALLIRQWHPLSPGNHRSPQCQGS